MLQLGLIGDNIKRSKSPLLHRLAGQLCGLDVSYEPLIPADMGLDFNAVFARCQDGGFRGINITYPYKELVFPRLAVEDARIRQIGACNTVLFEADGPRGSNTDYTGFIAAFRESLPGTAPGNVALVGAGGVGKAIAFGLCELGARQIRLFDTDRMRAASLAIAIQTAVPDMQVSVSASIDEAVDGCDGIINCTPLGMNGIPGTAVPRALMPASGWAFDAVYTPVNTQFMTDARESGLTSISGYELFFHQGVDAFRAFTGREVDMPALRKALLQAEKDGA
jgi:shikimate dehydrogenase